ncbi:MAG: signal peptidase II [Bdellovibrionales bacterium RBG_16_40_8]|nr:MAG: signal peptidase II [Bdellovibrionales bacterium RBG_16_40_8]
MLGRKYMILIAVTMAVVALDQYTKMIIHTTFDLNESVRVISGFFNFTYVRNTGAAFGIFGNAHETFRQVFFLSIPPIAIFIIVTFLYGLPETEKIEIYALSIISGGAMGNYIDRLRFGYVIDFLDFHIQHKYTWPAFNVADSAIVIGVAVLTLLMFRKKPVPKEQSAT